MVTTCLYYPDSQRYRPGRGCEIQPSDSSQTLAEGESEGPVFTGSCFADVGEFLGWQRAELETS
ncbi:hypothetical protein AB0323_19910 [Arthrobacter sp. NPDC080031]|uniref:hypothetical protein n=1 Tax=Arthrobacter sp. NPDC080031 TaxID=3155918 RepID=UPI003450FC5C